MREIVSGKPVLLTICVVMNCMQLMYNGPGMTFSFEVKYLHFNEIVT